MTKKPRKPDPSYGDILETLSPRLREDIIRLSGGSAKKLASLRESLIQQHNHGRLIKDHSDRDDKRVSIDQPARIAPVEKLTYKLIYARFKVPLKRWFYLEWYTIVLTGWYKRGTMRDGTAFFENADTMNVVKRILTTRSFAQKVGDMLWKAHYPGAHKSIHIYQDGVRMPVMSASNWHQISRRHITSPMQSTEL